MRTNNAEDIKRSRVLVVLATGLTFLALLVGYHLPPENGELGVVFPPWFTEAAAVTAIISAGGSLAGGTRFQNIVIAVAPDAEFSARVRANGALLTTAARGLCAPIKGLDV